MSGQHESENMLAVLFSGSQVLGKHAKGVLAHGKHIPRSLAKKFNKKIADILSSPSFPRRV